MYHNKLDTQVNKLKTSFAFGFRLIPKSNDKDNIQKIDLQLTFWWLGWKRTQYEDTPFSIV